MDINTLFQMEFQLPGFDQRSSSLGRIYRANYCRRLDQTRFEREPGYLARVKPADEASLGYLTPRLRALLPRENRTCNQNCDG